MYAVVEAAQRVLTVARVRSGLAPPLSKLIFITRLKQEDLTVYGRAGDVHTKFSSFTTSGKHDEMLFQPVRYLVCRHGIDNEKSDRNDI
jgi:hypothetical protein